jgi:TatD DNase family protein
VKATSPNHLITRFIDSHAHLTAEQFAPDLDAVIARAQEAGVERILTLGTDVASSRAAIALAEKYAPVYAAVGVHPEVARTASLQDVETIRELAAAPKVVAIGEIGLDYYWDKESADLQQQFFERQLELAVELSLPVAIHDREAHEQVIRTLESLSGRGVRGVLHSFSGDEAMAQEALALGFFISFAGPVTFLNAHKPPAIARTVPLEKLLVETDSPYLSPHPLRGRRNEPANVTRVAGRIAELKGLGVWEVAAQTAQNARALFGF